MGPVQCSGDVVDDGHEGIESVGAVDDDVDRVVFGRPVRRVTRRGGRGLGRIPAGAGLVEGESGGVVAVDGAEEAIAIVPPQTGAEALIVGAGLGPAAVWAAAGPVPQAVEEADHR